MASKSCLGRAKQSLETRLVCAIRLGDADTVRHILDQGVNVNVLTSSGETAIGVAAQTGDVTVMRMLLSYDDSATEEEEEVLRKSSKCSQSADSERTTNMIGAGGGKNNCGYFVVYHDELEEEDGEGRTPDGMEHLEWDVEEEFVEGAELGDGGGGKEEELWACQYRWYADILDKTTLVAERDATDGLDVRLDRRRSRRKCEVNLQDVHGCAAIHYAATQGHVDVIRMLIEAGCQVDAVDSASQTALHLAAANGHTAVVELLLQLPLPSSGGGCKLPTAAPNGGNGKLPTAASSGDERYSPQVNVETGDSRRMSPLHMAAVRGHTRTCALLLRHGARVNALDSCDRTPLYLAVARQHLNTVRLLLRHGANVNIEEIHGYTAMCEAVWSKNVAMVATLVQSPRPPARLCPAHQLLRYAVLHRHAAMVALLLPLAPHAASVNAACDETGDTPLMLAARTSQLQVARLLLSHGARANAVNAVTGCTPLLAAVESLSYAPHYHHHHPLHHHHHHMAAMSPPPPPSPPALTEAPPFEAMVRLLVAHGADLDFCAGADYTPLTKLIVLNKFSMAAFLIRLGANVNKCTKMGDYVFDNLVLARNFKQFTLVQMIVFAGYKLSRKKLDQLMCAGGGLAAAGATGPPKRAPPTDIDTWLQQTAANPWPLTHLCRLIIRRHHLGGRCTSEMSEEAASPSNPTLVLPNLLKRFIAMEEFQVEDQVQQTSANDAAATTTSSLFI